jgi:hypothetical protein
MSGYRWSHPHDWLEERIYKLATPVPDNKTQAESAADKRELMRIAWELAKRLSADDVQDAFQDDMDGDGYFRPQFDRATVARAVARKETGR